MSLLSPSLVKNPNFISKYQQLVLSASGHSDIYTCPSSKRALIMSWGGWQTSGTNPTFYQELKVGSTYYRMGSGVTINDTGSALTQAPFLLEAGDIFALNAALIGATNLNFTANIIEFDADSMLTQGRVLGPSSGFNTIYTCPTGYTAFACQPTNGFLHSNLGGATASNLFIADGSNRSVYWALVPSGQSVSSTYKVTAALSVTSNTRGGTSIDASFAAGDFLSINVDTGNAAQVAFTPIVQVPDQLAYPFRSSFPLAMLVQ